MSADWLRKRSPGEPRSDMGEQYSHFNGHRVPWPQSSVGRTIPMCLRDEQQDTFGCLLSASWSCLNNSWVSSFLSVMATASLRTLLGLLLALRLRPRILLAVLQAPYLPTHTYSAPRLVLGMQGPCPFSAKHRPPKVFLPFHSWISLQFQPTQRLMPANSLFKNP